jgi:DNA topoisomerase IA
MSKRLALCVAEKPSVAKAVSEFLSRGRQMHKVRLKRINDEVVMMYV